MQVEQTRAQRLLASCQCVRVDGHIVPVFTFYRYICDLPVRRGPRTRHGGGDLVCGFLTNECRVQLVFNVVMVGCTYS
jgi:hypothetical protein